MLSDPKRFGCCVYCIVRSPCLQNSALKDNNWDLSQWVPLIEDRMFLPWLVKAPTESDVMRARYELLLCPTAVSPKLAI